MKIDIFFPVFSDQIIINLLGKSNIIIEKMTQLFLRVLQC